MNSAVTQLSSGSRHFLAFRSSSVGVIEAVLIFEIAFYWKVNGLSLGWCVNCVGAMREFATFPSNVQGKPTVGLDCVLQRVLGSGLHTSDY